MTGEKIDNKKHRILIVIRHPVGGIRTFVRYVYNQFDQSLYHFTILAPYLPELKILLNDLKNQDVSYVQLESNPTNLKFLKAVVKNTMGRKFDLIHSVGFTSGVISCLPARLTRTRHLMTSQDVLQAKQFPGLKGCLKKKVLSILFPMIDIIQSVTNDANSNLLEFVPTLKRCKNKCIVIPNAVDVQRFKGSKERNLRKELNLTEDTFLIGFLGRFMSQKGFIYLVEALELIVKTPDLPKKPVVVTFGEGGFRGEEKIEIRKKGLDKYFHFLPFVPNVASTLRGLDVLAMPSLWEAYGILAAETMVVGMPLIGTDCVGLREVLKGTPAVMVPAGDGAALADALTNEIKNPSRAETEAFREEAAQRFDVKKQATELEKVVMRLLKDKVR